MTDAEFKKHLADYKRLIDDDIDSYCAQVNQLTKENYGVHSGLTSLIYTDILRRGGKRIRGILTCVGYEMCGGKNREVMVQAARAIEMAHAYLLILDDVQDRSDQRRGGPSAHKMIAELHDRQKWHGDADHTGVSLALNSALLGLHGAEMVLANLEVSSELRAKALNIMNNTMLVTLHGQTNDIVNELVDKVSEKAIESVLQWKTAHYSFLNPIHMGMVLAGAPCEDTNAITRYALRLGKAFQITDDLLVVSSDPENGKNPIDDIREGKKTLLMVYALQNAKDRDANFLKRCLGNQDLTEAEFEQCEEILFDSGAVDYARQKALNYTDEARRALHDHDRPWDKQSVEFLDKLADYILARSA
jgi:geranylgeranyl diphosphate synthase, type I